MVNPVSIGNVPWSDEDMRAALPEFAEVYARRPIPNNPGGMSSAHLFAMWFVVKVLQPPAIIESGVLRGQGTWFLEQAAPEAELHSLDPGLAQRVYISPRAQYHSQDFSTLDWSRLPSDTFLFFDDHQNAYERLRWCKWLGFSRVMFEDNYPPGHGDCYSPKMILAGSGFTPHIPHPLRRWRERILPRYPHVAPNWQDCQLLRDNLRAYREMPPIFHVARTRWGEAWDDTLPTPAPLLTEVRQPYEQTFFDEAAAYTWICYLRLAL